MKNIILKFIGLMIIASSTIHAMNSLDRRAFKQVLLKQKLSILDKQLTREGELIESVFKACQSPTKSLEKLADLERDRLWIYITSTRFIKRLESRDLVNTEMFNELRTRTILYAPTSPYAETIQRALNNQTPFRVVSPENTPRPITPRPITPRPPRYPAQK